MNRNLKRTLSIILSTCLVISMYHGEIIAIRPNEREDYVPEFSENAHNKKDNRKTSGSIGLKKLLKLC